MTDTEPDFGADFGATAGADPLIISLPAFEGPLALLLELARRDRIDLAKISMLALVEQYLQFIERARALRLELAADYLLMAAALAHLKSLLLLPAAEPPDPDPAEIAEQLRWRLRRLQAMRDAAAALANRPQLGRDVAVRGAPEGLRCIVSRQPEAQLHELLRAYAHLNRPTPTPWQPRPRTDILGLEQALAQLRARTEGLRQWTDLRALLPETQHPRAARSALASSFVAALELARLGRIDLAQQGQFAPLRVRGKSLPAAAASR